MPSHTTVAPRRGERDRLCPGDPVPQQRRQNSNLVLGGEVVALLLFVPFLAYLWTQIRAARLVRRLARHDRARRRRRCHRVKLAGVLPAILVEQGDLTPAIGAAFTRFGDVSFMVSMIPMGFALAAVAAIVLRSRRPARRGWAGRPPPSPRCSSPTDSTSARSSGPRSSSSCSGPWSPPSSCCGKRSRGKPRSPPSPSGHSAPTAERARRFSPEQQRPRLNAELTSLPPRSAVAHNRYARLRASPGDRRRLRDGRGPGIRRRAIRPHRAPASVESSSRAATIAFHATERCARMRPIDRNAAAFGGSGRLRRA